MPEGAESPAVRTLALAGQVRHNPDFAEDRTDLEALDPYLVPLRSSPHLAAVAEAIRSLPFPVVSMLRGKAIYLTPKTGGGCVAVWHAVSTNLAPECAGMQPGVFVAGDADSLVRALGRMIRETVLEGQYFGLYAYPLQYPALQALSPERRRVFGRRRDRLPDTEYGYFDDGARADAQVNFSEHFRAFLREREAFLDLAEEQAAAGHPEFLGEYRFFSRMIEGTPAA